MVAWFELIVYMEYIVSNKTDCRALKSQTLRVSSKYIYTLMYLSM